MKYRAVYEREPDGRWTVEVRDVPGCHTYGRTIAQTRERLREALSLFTDASEKAEFEEQIKLPDTVQRSVRTAKDLRATVSREEAKMVTAQIKAVHVLRNKLKLGHRDAGALLGLSHQRVQQLERRAPRVHGAILAEVSQSARRRIRASAKKR
jgi:predicted RNase H-like HicB family nuclease